MTKGVKPAFLERDDGIRQQPLFQSQKQTNGLFCIRVLSENKKKPVGLRTWKIQLKSRVLLELPLLVSDVRNLKKVDLSPPTGAKRESYKYVESFDKAAIRHNTILHYEETLADSKYS